MQLTMLGTGSAMVLDYYNTCFLLSNNKQHFLIDGGGGNGIFKQLRAVHINWQDIKEIFVSHNHLDHILGIVWFIRMICQFMGTGNYEGEAKIYAHDEVIYLLDEIAKKVLLAEDYAFIGKRLHLIEVKDGAEREIIGKRVKFFDIGSLKTKQFGFLLSEKNKKICFCGDEPLSAKTKQYALNVDWLLCEAFCLYSQRELFKPYEKNHSTCKDAAEIAQELGVKNLILYHTEDKNLKNRKELYRAEALQSFKGNVFVPEDLEVLEL